MKKKIFFVTGVLIILVVALSLRGFTQQDRSFEILAQLDKIMAANIDSQKVVSDKLDKIIANQQEIIKTLEFLKIRSYRGN